MEKVADMSALHKRFVAQQYNMKMRRFKDFMYLLFACYLRGYLCRILYVLVNYTM